ncbi:MAG: GGDEF domain-containing protein [Gammaproteobacteria bacterium]|nr:GGDEF domain-containing protein [Gammaproteobacteria bacterium]MBU1776292.1 GGDEF domain-containing protein [Gammaproteobacteria bacterium]MBU1969555.1 GGDEF domain-containing protein [Gammaproteobacteria bacterium]
MQDKQNDDAPEQGRTLAPRRWLGKSSRRVVMGGVLLAPVVWWADTAVDHFIFGEGASFFESLLHPTPMEIWVRLMAGFMFITFGVYAGFLLDRSERIEGELRASNQLLEQLKAELEQLVVVDPLTGVFNRRKFHEYLGMSITAAMRHKQPFVLLMLDIDNFKRINDRYGHQLGDAVLRTVCELIGSSVREADLLFRVGGEEFCLVATSMDLAQARTLGEKIRQVIESHRFPKVGEVTISIGIASFREGDTQQNIYARADGALYVAKRRGRNCVSCDG